MEKFLGKGHKHLAADLKQIGGYVLSMPGMVAVFNGHLSQQSFAGDIEGEALRRGYSGEEAQALGDAALVWARRTGGLRQ